MKAGGKAAEMLAARAAAGRPTMRRAVIAAVVAAAAGAGLLSLSGWFLAAAAAAGAAGALVARAFNYLIPSASIRLLAIARTGARYAERYYAHAAALRALAGLRTDLFRHLAAVDPRDTRDLAAGDATARLTTDVDQLEDRIIRAPAAPAAAAAVAVALLVALLAGPIVVGVVAAGLAALPPAAARLSRWLVDRPAAAAATEMGVFKEAVAAAVAAAADIAAYGAADRAAAELAQIAARHDRLARQAARGEAVVQGLIVAAGPLLAALVVLFSTAAVPVTAAAALGVAAATEGLAALVRARARQAASASGLARLDRLAERPVAAPAGPVAAGGTIGIDGREFPPGTRLFLAGPSGSGKTRLVETLACLRRDAPERLTLDGVAVQALPFARAAATFALARQEPALLAGTIADNLRLARGDADDGELWEALAVACLDARVRALRHGLATWIGDNGAGLSGGERKRLGLARAVLAGRPWLLLDEPAEGLDPATEAELCRRLGAWLDRTATGLVLSSHRPRLAQLAGQCFAVAPGLHNCG